MYYFWLCWVFVAACWLSLGAVSGDYSLVAAHCGLFHCSGFSGCGAQAPGAWASGLAANGLSS